MRTISPCGSRSCSDARRDARSRAPREFIDGIVRCEMFLSDLGTLARGSDARAARDEIAARAELGLIRAVFSAQGFC
ncbi:hypothetical protein [Bradyrhizobium sp. WSM1417]|uniref:hypothetical protein n=1 Tax=Bradyrhizobium sp. WSM1417 TaxID=754500 RepID=UPI0018DB3D46|nr:hypothetical protein [Bradyrhizobium sp. WSM1417]